jgi:hypothetical protein
MTLLAAFSFLAACGTVAAQSGVSRPERGRGHHSWRPRNLMPLSAFPQCRGRESNPQGNCFPEDFKSPVSTDSTTPATLDNCLCHGELRLLSHSFVA